MEQKPTVRIWGESRLDQSRAYLFEEPFNLAKREWEWCRENPVSRISLEKGANKRERWLTEDEEARLLAACPSWLRELVVFALHSGMRLGEILTLTWSAVDLFRRTVTVFRSKNGERRTVPLNYTVMALLTEKTKLRHLKTSLVFPSQAGTPLDPNHLRRALRLAMAKTGTWTVISTTSDTPSRLGWFNPASICTRCSGCSGTSLR